MRSVPVHASASGRRSVRPEETPLVIVVTNRPDSQVGHPSLTSGEAHSEIRRLLNARVPRYLGPLIYQH